MNLDDARERIAAAGEYVLGTLVADERVEFGRVLAVDAALQREVYAWQDQLLGLARRAAPVEPPAELWQHIEDALERASPFAAGLDRAPAANDALWRRLRLWQTVSGLAIAASLALATLLLVREPLQLPAERYLAVLSSPDERSTGWVVELIAGDRLRLVPVGDTPAPPPGKVLQFWTKAEGAAGPTSLGLVRAGEVTELPLSRLPAVGARQLFELTLEDAGGSPLGRPTGPVLFIGRTVRL